MPVSFEPGLRLVGIAGIDIDGDHFEGGSAKRLLQRVERRHLRLHGTHHVAHRLNSTTRSFQSDNVGPFPAWSRNDNCSGRIGAVAGVSAAISPLSSGVSFLARSTAGRQAGSTPALRWNPPIPYTTASPAIAPRMKAAGMNLKRRKNGLCFIPVGLGDGVMSNKMWGGRFASGPDAIMEAINASIDVDRHLYRQDITASKAHAAMLAEQGIISADDAGKIAHGLDTILSEIEDGKFTFQRALEDVRMNVESRLDRVDRPGRRAAAHRALAQRPGGDRFPAVDAGRHRPARWTRSPHIQRALAEKALEHAGTVMPGLTHLQTAQPVTFGHHLLAYVEMAARDRGRFADARKRLNEFPLGSAALAGTSFDLDRDMTAKALGFDRPTANSLDAVSDRDFVLETLAAASICAVHLSRLAEEIVIWTSPLVGLLALSDKFTTGSSIMPQKRNPDAAELVRAKSGRIAGALTALLMVMKGLPLAYQKDMQEDKEGAMDALAALSLSLAAMTGMVRDMTPDTARMKKAAGRATRPRPISPIGWCGR